MLFSALEPSLQVHLTRQATTREFGDGQIIQHHGEMADGFWLIEEGSVTVGQFLPGGEFRAVVVLGPGDSYGELAIFAGRPRIVDAVSRGASRLKLIKGRNFLDALGNYPQSMRALLGAMSVQLQELLTLIAGLRQGTNPARIAGLLANMAGDNNGAAEVAVTQQELADLLGVTRATANAALRELERAGMIRRRYGSIAVPDRDRLVQFALG